MGSRGLYFSESLTSNRNDDLYVLRADKNMGPLASILNLASYEAAWYVSLGRAAYD